MANQRDPKPATLAGRPATTTAATIWRTVVVAGAMLAAPACGKSAPASTMPSEPTPVAAPAPEPAPVEEMAAPVEPTTEVAAEPEPEPEPQPEPEPIAKPATTVSDKKPATNKPAATDPVPVIRPRGTKGGKRGRGFVLS